jgi:hypothetical protein
MSLFNRKLWTGLTGTAAIVGLGAVQASEPVSGDGGTFPASVTGETVPFSRDLAKILDGEGGEGGIGFSQSGPVFATPALTGEQLAIALPGRTIRKDQAVAIYFGTNGQVGGWKRLWTKTDDLTNCPTPLGENHELENGVCYTAPSIRCAGLTRSRMAVSARRRTPASLKRAQPAITSGLSPSSS